MNALKRILVILCCTAMPTVAQETATDVELLTRKVAGALKKFGIEQHCEIVPEDTKEGSRLRVNFKNMEGYDAADLSRIFNYMSSEKVGLALLSLDMGRPDTKARMSTWRPKFFQVTSAKSASAVGINIPERLVAATQAISQLSGSMNGASITSLRFQNQDAELSMDIPMDTPMATPKLAIRAKRILSEMGSVQSTSSQLSHIKKGLLSYTWTVAFGLSESTEKKPPSRLEIGLKILEAAHEFEVHERLSVGRIKSLSGPMVLNLSMERPRKLRDIIEIATAIENCHPGLALTGLNIKVDSVAADEWLIEELHLHPSSADVPKPPSSLAHFVRTARTLSGLGQQHQHFKVISLRARDEQMYFSLVSESLNIAWIRDAQRTLGAMSGISSFGVATIGVHAMGSQMQDVTIAFINPNTDLKKRFQVAMKGSGAQVISAVKDASSLAVKLTVDATRTTGLINRLLKQAPEFGADSMKVIRADTRDGTTTLVVSYQ